MVGKRKQDWKGMGMDSESTDCVIMSSRGVADDAAISPHPRRLLRPSAEGLAMTWHNQLVLRIVTQSASAE